MECLEGLGLVLILLVIVVVFIAIAAAASPMGLFALGDLLGWIMEAVFESAS